MKFRNVCKVMSGQFVRGRRKHRDSNLLLFLLLCGTVSAETSTRRRDIVMMTDFPYEKQTDGDSLWTKGFSRFRRWLLPAVTAVVAAVALILIIVLAVSNVKTSNRFSSMEQSLNASMQQAQETAKAVELLQVAVDNSNNQLNTVAEAMKHLSVVDSLSRTVASLKCYLERIINNSSVRDGCCPVGWAQYESDCYYFSTTVLSWNDSRVWCEKNEGHLVILLTDKAWNFVTRHTNSQLFWIGLSNWRSRQWEWVNGNQYRMDRRRWLPGQPDGWRSHGPRYQDCAHLDSIGRLNDVYCDTKMRYICQKHSQRI
ncbi:asialoglycoprotein receptor 1 isoform X2 [Dicentrarchus labrax]|uniref:asialoglycoprotein receptor 1 isoform X2 n=1 Tax=Dicentrarchus labrax TaxID=13489 RepID=UPI0021F5C682|nr:asialoglycoprotein receptor 1 isoform X2 [Dicentrarchus labrax]